MSVMSVIDFPRASRAGTAARVCPPSHKHALTSTCRTTHRCQCFPCRVAAANRQSEERRLKATGRWDRAFCSPWHAATHIHVLMRFGYSHEAIARAAGVSARTVHRIVMGRLTRTYPRISAAILAVKPTIDDLEPSARISAQGSRRRVEALACLGWSIAALAEQLGATRSALAQRVAGTSTTVAAHRELAALYDRLWATPPTAATVAEAGYIARTKRHARALGWVPPMGWDDIDTDPEPPACDDGDGIDVIAVELAVEGARIELSRAERHLAVAQLHAAGHGDQVIADMLCVSDKTIGRDREHLGLPAVEEPTSLTRGRVA